MEGLDHPSQINSLDGTESLNELYASLTSVDRDTSHAALPSAAGQPHRLLRQPEILCERWHNAGLYNPVHRITIVPSPRVNDQGIYRIPSLPAVRLQRKPSATASGCNVGESASRSESDLAAKVSKSSEREWAPGKVEYLA